MKDLAIWLFLSFGLCWLTTVEAIALKHFWQGGNRMVRDMMADMEPRLGQPRSWEPGERRERLVMWYGTCVMVAAAGALFLVLELGT